MIELKEPPCQLGGPAGVTPPTKRQQRGHRALSSSRAGQRGTASVASLLHWCSGLGAAEAQQLTSLLPSLLWLWVTVTEGYGGHLGEETPEMVSAESLQCM